MSKHTFYLSGFYIRLMAEMLDSMGHNSAAVLAKYDLTLEQFDHSSEQLSWELFKQLMMDSYDITNEPALGLIAGKRLQPNTHGVVGFAASNAISAMDSTLLWQQFLPLRTSMLDLNVHKHGDLVDFSIEELVDFAECRVGIMEAVVLAIKNMLDFRHLGHSEITSVSFSFPRQSYAHLTEELFDCEILYDQPWSGLTLPLDVAERRLATSSPIAYQEAVHICQQELQKLSPEILPLSAKVKRILFSSFHNFPSLEVLARMFNLTSRTLHRHLQQEGVSYKIILDEVRCKLAREHLKANRLNIEEIAYTLGYSDIASFRRAFKRWENMAPSAYRMLNTKSGE